jgi:hypothetical protein
MICPKCGEEFTNRSYSELCPACDCGTKGAHEHGWFTDWEMQQAELKGYNRGNSDGMDYGRKAEREKVLERLTEELNEMGCYGDVCCLEYFKKVVKKLRQEGKEEK